MTSTQSTQRDELARTLMEASTQAWEKNGSRHWPNMAESVLAAGYRKPRTITLIEELSALPDGTVILDPDGDVARKVLGGWTTTVMEDDGSMWLTDNQEDVDLPATVLWEPDAEAAA